MTSLLTLGIIWVEEPQPQEWSNFVDRMETDNTLFDQFLEYVTIVCTYIPKMHH